MASTQNRRIIVIDDNEAIHIDFRRLLVAATNDALIGELDDLETQLFGEGEASGETEKKGSIRISHLKI